MKKTKRPEETRAALLQAAASGFAAKGYAETGVAEICERAAVSKGAFYYHFPGKRDLFLELLRGWLESLETMLDAAVEGASDIPHSLIDMAALMQPALEADCRQRAIFPELWAQAGRDEAVRRASADSYARYRDIFARLIERGIAEGSLRPVDPRAGAQVILSLASGLFLQSLVDPRGSDWGKAARTSIALVLDGIKRRPVP